MVLSLLKFGRPLVPGSSLSNSNSAKRVTCCPHGAINPQSKKKKDIPVLFFAFLVLVVILGRRLAEQIEPVLFTLLVLILSELALGLVLKEAWLKQRQVALDPCHIPVHRDFVPNAFQERCVAVVLGVGVQLHQLLPKVLSAATRVREPHIVHGKDCQWWGRQFEVVLDLACPCNQLQARLGRWQQFWGRVTEHNDHFWPECRGQQALVCLQSLVEGVVISIMKPRLIHFSYFPRHTTHGR